MAMGILFRLVEKADNYMSKNWQQELGVKEAYKAGYRAAFTDVTDFIHERIDHYIEYDMQYPYIDDEKLYEDLCR